MSSYCSQDFSKGLIFHAAIIDDQLLKHAVGLPDLSSCLQIISQCFGLALADPLFVKMEAILNDLSEVWYRQFSFDIVVIKITHRQFYVINLLGTFKFTFSSNIFLLVCMKISHSCLSLLIKSVFCHIFLEYI